MFRNFRLRFFAFSMIFVHARFASGLINGSTINIQHPSSQESQIQCSTVQVGIRYKNPDPKTQAERPYIEQFPCTGTISDSEEVTSAGHCFGKGLPADGSIQPVVKVTVPNSSGQLEAKVIPIISIRSRVPIPYKPETMAETQKSGSDITILKIASKSPPQCVTEPCKKYSTAGKFLVAGYGVFQNPKKGSDGNLYTPSESQLRFGPVKIQSFNESSLTARANTKQKIITCSGDSGGPLYYANPSSPSGKLCLAGIVSGSTAGEKSHARPNLSRIVQACSQKDGQMVFNHSYSSSDPSMSIDTPVPNSGEGSGAATQAVKPSR